MARETGLEPATSGVTGRRSNQLSYSRVTRMCPRGTRGELKAGPGEVKDVGTQSRNTPVSSRSRSAAAPSTRAT